MASIIWCYFNWLWKFGCGPCDSTHAWDSKSKISEALITMLLCNWNLEFIGSPDQILFMIFNEWRKLRIIVHKSFELDLVKIFDSFDF